LKLYIDHFENATNLDIEHVLDIITFYLNWLAALIGGNFEKERLPDFTLTT